MAPTYLIEKIEDDDGNILYRHIVSPRTSIPDPGAAAAVRKTLEVAAQYGTGTRAVLDDRQIAGKTGTHQGFREAWFIGFIPQYTSSIWVGFAEEQLPLTDVEIKGEIIKNVSGGRLIMADALAFAAEKKPDLICDVATLTGAAYVALGVDIGAVISNSEKYSGEFIKSNKNQVESYHELPLFQGYKSLIKSSIADMKNTGGRFGGAITAALILEEFVDETPWVHLDIAGPARARSGSALNPEGGTGFGVIGFLNFFKLLSKNYQ